MSSELNSRADAELALAAFQEGRRSRGELSGDDRENITDLLTDLMHLIDSDPGRFDDYDAPMIVETARENYYDERPDVKDETPAAAADYVDPFHSLHF